ncbi:MAG: phosphatase PAP2 family protein, partial [Bacteroidota bacterium]
SIDRHAADGYDRSLVEASDWLLYGSYALPLTLLANRQTRKDFGTISVMMAEVLLVTNDITSITKSTTQRVRPFVYNSEAPLEDKTTKNAKLSFISGHTSNVAAMSFFTAKVISDYSDNRALKRVTWSLAIALPATVGFMRYQSGKHFATDVLAGYAVGALVGYLVPALHKRKSNRLDISLAPGIGQTPSQLGMRWRF